MRIPLFSALAMSALLASTASAQAPSSGSTAAAQFPSADETSRPAGTAKGVEKPSSDSVLKIGWRWREPAGENALPAANTDAPAARGAGRLWVTNEMLTWW